MQGTLSKVQRRTLYSCESMASAELDESRLAPLLQIVDYAVVPGTNQGLQGIDDSPVWFSRGLVRHPPERG